MPADGNLSQGRESPFLIGVKESSPATSTCCWWSGFRHSRTPPAEQPRLQRISDSLSCLSARIHSPCPRKSGPPPKQSASTSPDSSGNSLVTYVKHGPRISCNLSVSECCLPPVTSQRPSCLFTVVGDPGDPGSPFKGSHIFTSSWPGREAKARRLSQLRGNSFRSVRDREAGSVF